MIRKFEIPDSAEESQVACRISRHEEFLLSLTDKGNLYCFQFSTGKLLKKINTGANRAIGLAMHPKKNILACHFQEGILKLFEP